MFFRNIYSRYVQVCLFVSRHVSVAEIILSFVREHVNNAIYAAVTGLAQRLLKTCQCHIQHRKPTKLVTLFDKM